MGAMCAGHVPAMKAAIAAAAAASKQHELGAIEAKALAHALLVVAAVLPQAASLPLPEPVTAPVQQMLEREPEVRRPKPLLRLFFT